jgi:hypothetical protein
VWDGENENIFSTQTFLLMLLQQEAEIAKSQHTISKLLLEPTHTGTAE